MNFPKVGSVPVLRDSIVVLFLFPESTTSAFPCPALVYRNGLGLLDLLIQSTGNHRKGITDSGMKGRSKRFGRLCLVLETGNCSREWELMGPQCGTYGIQYRVSPSACTESGALDGSDLEGFGSLVRKLSELVPCQGCSLDRSDRLLVVAPKLAILQMHAVESRSPLSFSIRHNLRVSVLKSLLAFPVIHTPCSLFT
jgi:hypothetical protein